MEQDRKRLRKGGAIAIAVSGDAADYVNDFRRRYDPHVARILPHITLAVAPELDACDWMPARARITQALARIPPFTIRVAELGTFMDDLVLWLRPVAPHGELLTLRQTILRSFPDVAFDRVDDFVPHISIGFFSSSEDLLEARDAVCRELIPFSFHVGSISYLQADEGNIWQCVDTVELGGLSTGAACSDARTPGCVPENCHQGGTMNIFYCDACRRKFEAEGVKTNWIDRTYGPCTRWTASCPDCGEECQLAKTVHAHGDGGDGCEGGSCDCGGSSCSCGGSGCSSCGGC